MALKNGKVNELNAKGIRKVPFPARHFHYTTVTTGTGQFHTKTIRVNQIDKWIYQNLNSRYYIGTSLALIDNSVVYITKVGFENEKEVSFFNLACPYIK